MPGGSCICRIFNVISAYDINFVTNKNKLNYFDVEVLWNYTHISYRSAVKVKVIQLCPGLSATPGTIQSTEFSRPEHWNGEPFPSPGDLSNAGIEARAPTMQADSLPTEPQGKAIIQAIPI